MLILSISSNPDCYLNILILFIPGKHFDYAVKFTANKYYLFVLMAKLVNKVKLIFTSF